MHRLMCQIVTSLVILVAFPSCSASGPLFQQREPEPGRAQVVIYRDWWNGNTFYFTANGEEIADLSANGYFPLDVEPGKVQLNVVRKINFPFLMSLIDNLSMKGQVLLEVNARAGQTYYARFDSGWGGTSLELVPGDAALKALDGLRMTDDLRDPEGNPTSSK